MCIDTSMHNGVVWDE